MSNFARIYNFSPKDNVAWLRKKFWHKENKNRDDLRDELESLSTYPLIVEWANKRNISVAGFSRIPFLMRKLDYFFKNPDEIIPYYLGRDFFGPLPELNRRFSLQGKRVVEFGPFDGCQTLGLTHLGADVTAIEARAENAVKTRAALDATGLTASIVMEDFHDTTAARHGRFDLAFAHGVYYHSHRPFVFLGNLIDLSDNIFVGGFCATDDLPSANWETLSHEGHTYRVKSYREVTGFTAGIHDTAYFFDADALMAFFKNHGFEVEVIDKEKSSVTAGQFLRFLARRK
jgi:hypothetical protein